MKIESLRLEWKPQDLWVGAFWKSERASWSDFDDQGRQFFRPIRLWDLWVCLLPCLPIHVRWRTFPSSVEAG